MPIYEYTCKKCDSEFELLVNGSAKPACPACKSKKLEKRHSVFSASVKDGGKEQARPMASPPCGACGDPRGPGACSLN